MASDRIDPIYARLISLILRFGAAGLDDLCCNALKRVFTRMAYILLLNYS